MKILITGSRDWDNQDRMAEAFEEVRSELGDSLFFLTANGFITEDTDLTIIHGDARGADRMAGKIGPEILRDLFRAVYVEAYAADWETHGKAAGPIRNQEMIDLEADMCLAFFKTGAGNRGTADCVSRAEKAGIPVRKFYSD